MGFKVASLFSGCGGLDLGFERAEKKFYEHPDNPKFEVVWSNDIDEPAMKTFADNFDLELSEDPQEVSNGKRKAYVGDIRDVSFRKAIKEKVDVVLGGFPCKDFSILRGSDDRKGIEVKRGRLYLEFVRALVEVQPKIFVAENVKGLISANDGAAYKQILDDFQNLKENWPSIREKVRTNGHKGKDVENYQVIFSEVLDFSEYGVPQGRERLIMVGVREDVVEKLISGKKGTNLLQNVIDDLKEKPTRGVPLTPVEVFEGEVLDELQEKYKNGMKKFEEYFEDTVSERAQKVKNETWPEYTMNSMEDYKKLNNVSGIDNEKLLELHKSLLEEMGYAGKPLGKMNFPDGSNEIMREQGHIKERMKRIPPYENHKMVRETEYEVGGMMSNIYRRVHPLRPSPTIIAAGGGGTWGYHWEIDRQKLTNRERARLQSFPDDFEFYGGNSDVRSQIGNAVPPFAARKIAESLLPILEQEAEFDRPEADEELHKIAFSVEGDEQRQLELV